MQATNLKVVCLGDSITWGFPFGPEYSWVRMLDDALEGEFINQGINGNTTSDMLRRFDRAVLKYNPSHVIIMGGINDIMWRESFDRITLNLKTMAEKAGAEGIKVILGTPTGVDDPEVERLLTRIRSWIKNYASQNDIPVIDFAAAFFDSNGQIRTELLLADGGHPTQDGYQAIFNQLDFEVFKY
ncbi:MAG: SGNH/GDSL hydrolase family protein [Syntrophomonas sp.]|nr:SGNH/GDSL hydrolase family protein [Syntrophomonas sp.]